MLYTPEQELLIRSESQNAKIVAVAGSGKTTTLLGYAQNKPNKSKLFLAYNSDINNEITHKITKNRILNTKAFTTHGLAYKVFGMYYKSTLQDKMDFDKYIEIFKLAKTKADKFVANKRLAVLRKLFSHYCVSAYYSIEEFMQDYTEFNPDLTDEMYKEIVSNTMYYTSKLNQYWKAMDNKEIPCIHDFYLKKYQLSKPVLNYDIILLDEAQDSTPVVIDIVLNQTKATKVLVGDNFQAIYGWRMAKDALAMVDFKTYYLTNSFRFHQGIADRAMESLMLNEIMDRKFVLPFEVHGKGERKLHVENFDDHMIISRSNGGIIKDITVKVLPEIKDKLSKGIPCYDKIYINGINSEKDIYKLFESEEGYHVFDIYFLYASNYEKIKNAQLKKYKNIKDLENFSEATGNVQLTNLIRFVYIQGGKVFEIVKDIKAFLTYDEKYSAYKYTTAHKSKGLEWDSIELLNNFVTKSYLHTWKKFMSWKEAGFPDIKVFFPLIDEGSLESLLSMQTHGVRSEEVMKQEINLLYVAITRGKYKVKFEEGFMEDVE